MFSSGFTGSKVNFFAFVGVIFAVLALTGCAGDTVVQTSPNIQDEASAGSDYYLRRMHDSSDEERAGWQLLAIRALLMEENYVRAAEQLRQLPRGLNEFQYQEQQLLEAELQIAQKSYSAISYILAKLKPESLSASQQIRYWQAQGSINQGIALLRSYISQQPLLSGNAYQENIDKTWQMLVQLTAEETGPLTINADEHILQGWLDLLYTWQHGKKNPASLNAEIREWQTRYPQNPAAKTLPTRLTQLNQKKTITIALLLPLSGPAKIFGDAILQGFIAAKDGLLAANIPLQQANTTTAIDSDSESSVRETRYGAEQPALSVSHAEIRTYDTSTQSTPALLEQAREDGAFLVVGPLLKPEVAQLATLTTSLNILALNRPEIHRPETNQLETNQLETNKSNPAVCYFALSPEDEARDAARHLQQQQKKTPLLLTPRGAFGDRIAMAFADEWYRQENVTVLQQTFGTMNELRQTINSSTGIRITGNPVRALTANTPPLPASGDVDAVYIVATPAELTLIKPMIDMAISDTKTKPALFSSSRSHQADAGPDYHLEMEGLQFSDIPLMAGEYPALMQRLIAKFGNDYSLVRLYAMGIDAWSLLHHFAEINHPLTFQLKGLTGILGTTENCIISRRLPWLRYHNGKIVPVAAYG